MNPKFHLSLDVENLEDTVRFYATLLGVPPAKLKPDYARFDVETPALNLTLQPKSHCCLQGLNHMGLRMDTREEVEAIKARLTAAGYLTEDELNTTCCYAVQDKFWVRDPSKYRWEVYVVKSDSEISTAEAGQKACCA
jgi:catechol 2,3-dioxygenase-like lactoylglutathione lyase family enzyme